ncbi:MAG: hypothetical protein WDO24_13250 [Pseudomonadota bacterium]
MDDRHRHNLTWAKTGTDDEAEAAKAYADNKVHDSRLKLLDPAMLKFHREFDDGISLAICGVFPNATFHQISQQPGRAPAAAAGAGLFSSCTGPCSATRTIRRR